MNNKIYTKEDIVPGFKFCNPLEYKSKGWYYSVHSLENETEFMLQSLGLGNRTDNPPHSYPFKILLNELNTGGWIEMQKSTNYKIFN